MCDSDAQFEALFVEYDLESIQCVQAIARGDSGDSVKHRKRMEEIHAEARANLVARLVEDDR
jgi:hypothetical protein